MTTSRRMFQKFERIFDIWIEMDQKYPQSQDEQIKINAVFESWVKAFKEYVYESSLQAKKQPRQEFTKDIKKPVQLMSMEQLYRLKNNLEEWIGKNEQHPEVETWIKRLDSVYLEIQNRGRDPNQSTHLIPYDPLTYL